MRKLQSYIMLFGGGMLAFAIAAMGVHFGQTWPSILGGFAGALLGIVWAVFFMAEHWAREEQDAEDRTRRIQQAGSAE